MPLRTFDVDNVVALMGLEIKKEGNRNIYCDCPLCNENRKRLSINVEPGSDKYGYWHCFNCGAGGTSITFLYANVNNIDNKTAYHRLAHAFYGDKLADGDTEGEKVKSPSQVTTTKRKKVPEGPVRSYEYMDRVNRAFMGLAQTALTEKHRKLLRDERKLSDEAIDRIGFRSMPEKGALTVPAQLVDAGIDPLGVPGFYKRGNSVAMLMAGHGFLIPIRIFVSKKNPDGKPKNPDGYIIGFQMRLDNDYREQLMKDTGHKVGKYITFSTMDKPYGVGIPKELLIAGFDVNHVPDRVCVTEGGLKAYIANEISGRWTIALLGVNNTSALGPTLCNLKKLGVKKVFECLDMDKTTNPDVAKAATKIQNIVELNGLQYSQSMWDPQFKGIDDYLIDWGSTHK